MQAWVDSFNATNELRMMLEYDLMEEMMDALEKVATSSAIRPMKYNDPDEI